jgi:hypothetical protein
LFFDRQPDSNQVTSAHPSKQPAVLASALAGRQTQEGIAIQPPLLRLA